MDNNEILLKLSLDANNTVNTLNEVNKGVKEIANTVKTTSNIFKEFSGFIKQCYTEFKENTSSIDKMNKALNGQVFSVNASTASINSQTSSIKTNTIAMQQATNVINAQNVVIKEATVRNRDFFDSLKLITSGYTLGNIIASEINKIIMSIKQFFTEAINGFKDLGRNVALVKGLILETGESLNVISDKITNVANKTGTLFTDAAEYIKKIVAGGVNNLDEAVKVYENSIALAKLSTSKFRSEQENLNDVTNSAILLLNNYNLKAKDLPTIYNQIAVAAAKSKLDVSDFTKYLGGQSGEFASFKGNFSDMISLYAVFANNLRNSSEADVALRAFMKKIQSPTAEMKKFAEDAVKRGLESIKCG
jgi:exonuclease VII small subunit